MNLLLKSQVEKYLPDDLYNHSGLTSFLNIVEKTYVGYDKLLVTNQYLEKESEKNTDLMSLKTQQIVGMNKQKDQLLKELESQNLELSNYAHVVSHDLKSPLRSIYVLTDWLEEDYKEFLGEQGKKTLNLIRDNVEKMEALVTGILEYSSLGKKDEVIYPVDLNLLVKEIIDNTDVPEHIVISIDNKLPIVNCDKCNLEQLFKNLIINAVAYNDKEKGSVNIGYSTKGEFHQFYVKDNGKGINNDYLEKVFTAFFKLENNQQSTGVGLSIVKKIVEMYNGKIWVDSKISKGTTFSFLIKEKRNGKT